MSYPAERESQRGLSPWRKQIGGEILRERKWRLKVAWESNRFTSVIGSDFYPEVVEAMLVRV